MSSDYRSFVGMTSDLRCWWNPSKMQWNAAERSAMKYWIKRGYGRQGVEKFKRKFDEHRKRFPFLDAREMPPLADCYVEKVDDKLLARRPQFWSPDMGPGSEWGGFSLIDFVEDLIAMAFSRREKIFLITHDMKIAKRVGYKETVREAIAKCPLARRLLCIVVVTPMADQIRFKYWKATVRTISRTTTMEEVLTGFDQRQREKAEARRAELEAAEQEVHQEIKAATA